MNAMKKGLSVFFFVSLLLIIRIDVVKSVPANLVLGESFIYEITSVGLYAEVGENTTIDKNFHFSANEYPEGTKINATVNEISSNGGVGFKFYIGDRSQIGYSTANWFDVLAAEYSYLTLYWTFEIVRDYNRISFLDLIIYQTRPYVNPLYNDYLESPESLGEEINSLFTPWSNNYPGIEYSYEHSEKDGKMLFESWVGGEVNDSFGNIVNGRDDYPSEISFGNSFHVAIDKETGIIHGFGRRGWVKGVINNKFVKVSIDVQYELEGYRMAKYHLGKFSNFAPGLDFVIAVSTIITLFIVSRKNLRNKKKRERPKTVFQAI